MCASGLTLTTIQHRRFILLPFPDDNNAVHLNFVQHFAHHVNSSLICCILVALAKPVSVIDSCRQDDGVGRSC